MNNDQLKKFIAKAKDSFNTRKNLYLFHLAITKAEKFSKDNFNKFEITEDLVKQYSTEYWQLEESKTINSIAIKDIYTNIKTLEKQHQDELNKLKEEYTKSFENKYPEDQFIELLNIKECHYCGITIDKVEQLADKKKLFKKSLRGWTLEIDRKNSNYEYTPDNCVMACYWCNNAKTDEFTDEEFLEVGKTIASIWNNRLR